MWRGGNYDNWIALRSSAIFDPLLGTGWRRCMEAVRGNTAFASMISGESVLRGAMAMLMKWKLLIIIRS